MQLKYRAFIDEELIHFDLIDLIEASHSIGISYAQIKSVDKRDRKLIEWINDGNQPDVFIGLDKEKNIIFTNDICQIDASRGNDFDYTYTGRASINMDRGFILKNAIKEDNTNGEREKIKTYSWPAFYRTLVIGNIHQNKDLIK